MHVCEHGYVSVFMVISNVLSKFGGRGPIESLHVITTSRTVFSERYHPDARSTCSTAKIYVNYGPRFMNVVITVLKFANPCFIKIVEYNEAVFLYIRKAF